MTDLYAECHAEGGMTAHYRNHDPQRLAFVAARYLFVAKMLEGRKSVLEIGCADGYFSPVVRQHVGALTAIDSDAASIEQAKRANSPPQQHIEFLCADFREFRFLSGEYDGMYALDVLEHVPASEEGEFLRRMAAMYRTTVIGMPSLASQAYASELSRLGHVNCKSGPELMDTLRVVWPHVAPFSMTDGALYAGFSPMARYYLAVCVA
jgi:2-polyprenyl-3-methyl-5-hydroxy-6-metoxy-1,4-benzoquinol methylase